METDLKRCKRATWLLTQHELYFTPEIGGQRRPVKLEGEEIDSLHEIVTIGNNFVLADRRSILDVDGNTKSIFPDRIPFDVP